MERKGGGGDGLTDREGRSKKREIKLYLSLLVHRFLLSAGISDWGGFVGKSQEHDGFFPSGKEASLFSR